MTEFLTLYALAAHFAGDWPLQSDRMAAQKFDDPVVRTQHVAIYTAVFVPLAVLAEWTLLASGLFLALLAVSHWIIDSQRWKLPVEGFESRPIWFDQAYHVVTLGVVVALTEAVNGV